jgi:undecaprenyl-diphosphatase
VSRVQADDVTHAILVADRRAGDGIRAAAAGVPGGRDWARLAADAMAPAFQGLALALVVIPGSRMLGLRAVMAGAIAGTLAKVARDAIDRPRPGSRTEGGFPSRHAASSAAIAVVVARERPLVGTAAHAAAALGMAARVAAADHDPLDVVAGAGLGAAAGRLMRRRRRRRRGTRP